VLDRRPSYNLQTSSPRSCSRGFSLYAQCLPASFYVTGADTVQQLGRVEGRQRRPVKFLGLRFVILFMGIVAFAASKTGLAVILFSELVALSHDVISRPEGKWASQPVLLILTPTATAIIGLFITRHLGYGVLSVSIVVMLSLIFIRLTKSAIWPAISAGVLPLVVGEKSRYYSVAILAHRSGNRTRPSPFPAAHRDGL
jgi:hypothetical protein